MADMPLMIKTLEGAIAVALFFMISLRLIFEKSLLFSFHRRSWYLRLNFQWYNQ